MKKRLIYFAIFITIGFLVSGCPMEMCKDCDEQYLLIASSTTGIISIDPLKTCYAKGDVVNLSYENTDPEYKFLTWLADPPDINVSNSLLDTVNVQIKDEEQYVTALVEKKKVLLTVQCCGTSFLMTGNRLNVPSGAINVSWVFINGEEVPCRYQVEYDRGTSTSVSASPAPGYIIDWCTLNNVCGGSRYNESSISLLMLGDISLSPAAIPVEDYNFDFHNISLEFGSGSGTFLCSGCSQLCFPCNLGLYPYNYACSYGRFTFGVVPTMGMALAFWECDNLFCNSDTVHADFTSSQNYNHSATAMLVNRVYLGIQDAKGRKYFDFSEYNESNEGGLVKIIEPDSSFLYPPSGLDAFPLGWDPIPYSPPSGLLLPEENYSPCYECNDVKLEAVPCKGAEFDHWEVSSDGCDWKEVYVYILTLYMDYFGPYDPENDPYNIYLPEGCTNIYVRPVFKLCCGFDCPECSNYAPDGRDVIIDMYNNPNVKLGNNMYPGPGPDCCGFVTNNTNHPLRYTNESLLPFNKLKCNHGTLPHSHEGWAIENGIADCYDAVDQKYNEEFQGHVNITCVYRCPVKNSSLSGSSLTSNHMEGKAFDFDQLSSLENWRVGKAANDCGQGYSIYLYYYDKNGDKKSLNFSSVSNPNTMPPPWEEYIFEHGHVGTESGN